MQAPTTKKIRSVHLRPVSDIIFTFNSKSDLDTVEALFKKHEGKENELIYDYDAGVKFWFIRLSVRKAKAGFEVLSQNCEFLAGQEFPMEWEDYSELMKQFES